MLANTSSWTKSDISTLYQLIQIHCFAERIWIITEWLYIWFFDFTIWLSNQLTGTNILKLLKVLEKC